jgi:hypothetical protein
VAAKGTAAKEFEEIWDWVANNIDQQHIKELFLGKDYHEQTVLKLVENRRFTKVFEKMKKWAGDFLNPEQKRIAFGQRR